MWKVDEAQYTLSMGAKHEREPASKVCMNTRLTLLTERFEPGDGYISVGHACMYRISITLGVRSTEHLHGTLSYVSPTIDEQL